MPLDGGPTTLVVMRHGETAWNREGRVMGRLEIPLTETGREQCRQAGEVLAGFSIDRIVSSPLVRAADSARIVAEQVDAEVEFDTDLEEVRYGSWEGKTYQDVVTEPNFHVFMEDPLSNPTPGGETIADVQNRGLASLSRATAGETVLFVSHGDIIRSVLCHYLGVPLAEFRRIRVDNCGLSWVAVGRRRAEVRFLNVLADSERAWDPVHWRGRG